MGLGKKHQGIPTFPHIPVNTLTLGLGYKPTKQEIVQKARQAREKVLARKEGRELPQKKLTICTMNVTWV